MKFYSVYGANVLGVPRYWNRAIGIKPYMGASFNCKKFRIFDKASTHERENYNVINACRE